MGSASVLVVRGGYADWRRQALHALAAGWPPDAITWTEHANDAVAEQMTLDYAAAEAQVAEPAPGCGAVPQVRISKDLAELLRDAALFRSSRRWAFLYRVLWRWQQGDRAVASAADEDGAQLNLMAKAVRRARHDMLAYVRFHRREGAAMPEYLSWYEPDHDVLADAAEHFAKRMGTSSWCIGTPQGAALWDGHALHLTGTPPDADAMRAGAQHDRIEPLWLVYYKSIFNPARLNETALQQRMPVRFWKGLPEGPLIPGMIAEARHGARRVGQTGTVGEMRGKPIAMNAGAAQPVRAAPTSLDQCRRCELWRHATQAVAGEGPDTARLMVIGEQPGDQEDLAGRAFAGPAGQVLDEALRRAGVPRDGLFLTNAVKHFKWIERGTRRMHKTPAQREVDACSHWLHQELARVRPAVIVTLGATALSAVLGRGASLQQYLHQPVRVGEAWLLATWHPSYALRVDGDEARDDVREAIAATLAQGWQLAHSEETAVARAAIRPTARASLSRPSANGCPSSSRPLPACPPATGRSAPSAPGNAAGTACDPRPCGTPSGGGCD
ncbi:bacteriophage-type DNA polymerase [Bordetella ansorpii]|uniref:Type-4 uracil-DNA glycosylase n=1 Tax=Bordetella ansorpii TaxID=288768 RepID=A0A157P6T4_9BORD|nr:UdgX family uracil-DNA binding protein [Bordetella ansorpii]SAI28639.1 bacteriophage-type DNA polymerase [Bordetella ansorpii]